MKKSKPKAHAKYSSSSSERWTECPGSISLTEKALKLFGEPEDSEYAKEGTFAHEVLETLLRGKSLKNFAVPKDMRKHCAEAAAWIYSQRVDGADFLIETKAHLNFIADDMGGTLDVAIVEHFGTLHVIDFKYGAGIAVEPEDNLQMLAYALSVAHKYDYNFSDYKLTIYQPRADHEKGPIRSWYCDFETLARTEAKFRQARKLAEGPNPPFKSDADGHCRWCPAAKICPELSSKALSRARIGFKDESPVLPVPHDMIKFLKPEQLGKTLEALDKIETWAGHVREHAFMTLKNGNKVPGWKLVDKRATRHWKDPEKAKVVAKRCFGKDAFSEPELLTPAQLEKKRHCNGYNLKDWVSKFSIPISSGLKLAPESAKGQERRPLADKFKD